MNLQQLLNGNLKITSQDDESGRRYYSIKLAFSDKDVLTVYHNSIEELVEELPSILGSAIQARIFNNQMIIN